MTRLAAALAIAGSLVLVAGAPGARTPDDRASLLLAAAEARSALVRRAAAPDATAATRRVARGLTLLEQALADLDTPLDQAIARRFTTAPAREVFVTGYHEPTLAARRRPDARFRHALYRPPPAPGDLPSRAAIEDGALAGRGLELFFTDDPIELFFLHVQGSGRLRLEDGTVVRVGYAGNNGHAYRSIGSVLVERGVFRPAEATAPAIKAWLRAHPGDRAEVLRQNPRYVFFRELPARASDGPPGALGVPLVPWRSVAVDPKVVPLGSIGRLRVPLPGRGPLDALVIAMDAGAAISGPRRLDLFCGADRQGEEVAGLLRHDGTIAWLVPRR